MQFITFHVDDECYAIRTNIVREVLPVVKLVKLPFSEPCISGLLNYRGVAVPVIDMTMLISNKPAALLMSSRMIITNYQVEDNDIRPLVLLAERATEIIKHDESDIQDYGLNMEQAKFLSKVIYSDQGVIQLIDIEHLLSAKSRVTLFKNLDKNEANQDVNKINLTGQQ